MKSTTVFPPWGIEDGGDALPNGIEVRRADRIIETYPNGKLNSIQLSVEDAVIILAGSDGGFGNPTDRDASAIRLDVTRGYVSEEDAREFYGVVLDPVIHTIDGPATNTLRDRLRDSRADTNFTE